MTERLREKYHMLMAGLENWMSGDTNQEFGDYP